MKPPPPRGGFSLQRAGAARLRPCGAWRAGAAARPCGELWCWGGGEVGRPPVGGQAERAGARLVFFVVRPLLGPHGGALAAPAPQALLSRFLAGRRKGGRREVGRPHRLASRAAAGSASPRRLIHARRPPQESEGVGKSGHAPLTGAPHPNPEMRRGRLQPFGRRRHAPARPGGSAGLPLGANLSLSRPRRRGHGPAHPLRWSSRSRRRSILPVLVRGNASSRT